MLGSCLPLDIQVLFLNCTFELRVQFGSSCVSSLRARLLSCALLWWCRQEDAQEFLSYVMDRMHEELLKRETAAAAPAPHGPAANGGPEGDDEWETVGPKNKSAVTRMHTHAESALSSIFGGELQSLVKTQGESASGRQGT